MSVVCFGGLWQVDIQQQAGVETQQDAVREDFSPLTNV
jgi:hypothetical protein